MLTLSFRILEAHSEHLKEFLARTILKEHFFFLTNRWVHYLVIFFVFIFIYIWQTIEILQIERVLENSFYPNQLVLVLYMP